ncbi:MAG TPA: PRC-barrel domain-containing protein [Longimicrobium sp.]|nr:PRC-barrel domain-containing protein [Longimicrobium sp.]
MDDGSSVIPLALLREFRIANGALDMRLWQVHSGDGRWIGSVDELLVDTGTMEVRYLDVEVENLLVTGRERHVLIPVAHARPHAERSDTVVVDELPARAVARLPTYHRGAALGGTDAEYARPFAAMRDATPGTLDLPVRGQPPRVVRALRVGTPPDAAGRGHERKAAVPAASAKEPARPTREPAVRRVRTPEPRAA